MVSEQEIILNIERVDMLKGKSGCGEWKQPLIANPAYKGKWRRPMIKNPAFKGVWKARMIPNPDHYVPEKPLEGLAPISAVGIELWTMSKQILFDNILVTDSEDVAREVATATFDQKQAEEARMKTSRGDSPGFWQQWLEQTEERPWLWAVAILGTLIPVILLAVYFCGRTSSSVDKDVGYRKKHDVLQEDDEEEAPPLVDEMGEEVGPDTHEAVEEEVAPELLNKSSPGRSPSRRVAEAAAKKSARQLIEEENASNEEEEKSESEEVEETVPVSKPKRGRPKKAD